MLTQISVTVQLRVLASGICKCMHEGFCHTYHLPQCRGVVMNNFLDQLLYVEWLLNMQIKCKTAFGYAHEMKDTVLSDVT